MHLDLPSEAKTETTRFRWWQPSHSGHGHDQWAIDEVQVGRYEHLDTLHDDFDVSRFLSLLLLLLLTAVSIWFLSHSCNCLVIAQWL